MFLWNARWYNTCWQFNFWLLCLSKSSLNGWKFLVQVLLKPGLENFEHYFASEWDECNCAVVWAFFGIAFLWDWNENWLFPVLWPLLSFPNLLAYWVQNFHSSIINYLLVVLILYLLKTGFFFITCVILFQHYQFFLYLYKSSISLPKRTKQSNLNLDWDYLDLGSYTTLTMFDISI